MGAASLAFSHLPSAVSSLRAFDWPVHECLCAHTFTRVGVCLCSLVSACATVCLCVCAPESLCVFLTAGAFYDVYSFSLPRPGVPVRTPRRPCACLPKTSASPGPPRGRGQPNVTWTLYRVVRGGRGEGGLTERETKVKEEILRYVRCVWLLTLITDLFWLISNFYFHFLFVATYYLKTTRNHLFSQNRQVEVVSRYFKNPTGGQPGLTGRRTNSTLL